MIIPVIMAGGSGTRLWPASRETMPKQFIPLLGEHSSYQDTLSRVTDSSIFADPIVLTHRDFRFLAAEQASAIGISAEIVIEPGRRDSAPAVAVAANLAAKTSDGAVVIVLPADHAMPDVKDFQKACLDAQVAAENGFIVTFGVKPTTASTSYGYLRPGANLELNGVHKLEAFVEKPDSATAERYLTQGYLWNTGNFLFRADVMRDEIAKMQPDIANAAAKSVAGAERDLDFLRLAEEPFCSAPKISIDYAVMEKTDKAAVLPVSFSWSDIGSWDAFWSLSDKDKNGNVALGSVHFYDTSNVLARSDDGILTAVVGIDDVLVVTTNDAVLVTSRKNAEKVKSLVESLKSDGYREAVEHRQVYRPWGYYQEIDSGRRYQVKRIVVKPGGVLSLQKHFHRAEHWVVVRGTAEVTYDETVKIVQENQSAYLPLGCVHRLFNPGKIPLELIEVQVGSYLGEDDIVRLEDIYNRDT